MQPDNSFTDFFFLNSEYGKLFSVYKNPFPSKKYRGEILFVHSFCEELNKSRRAVAIQASELSKLGFGVLQVDLFGCGDSWGKFEEARWKIWLENIKCAVTWLLDNRGSIIFYWGLRIGALLTLDYIVHNNVKNAKLILWQPVLSGKKFMKQFLRIAVSEINSGKNLIVRKRSSLEQGGKIELAGYVLNSELYNEINSILIERLIGSASIDTIEWFEVSPLGKNRLSIASEKIVNRFVGKKMKINSYAIQGASFWSTTEITIAQNLIEMTNSVALDL